MKRFLTLLVAVALAAIPAAAQKNRRKDLQQDNTAGSTSVTLTDNQKIEQEISEMLAAWQVGAVDAMHKYYADNVCVVSGAWEPPLFGWDAYAKAYLEQRTHIQGGEMDRSNTLIKVDGNTAWATYQWQYLVVVDGQPHDVRGHTSLVFDKQGDAWLIALNHTSLVSDTPLSRAPSSTAPSAPPSTSPAPPQ
jgi:ketosteroid isomerase-like protein